MTQATQQPANGLKRAGRRLRPARAATVSQAGAALFPHVVWAHWQWERRLHGDGVAEPELEAAYLAKLEEFQRAHGKLDQVYWSTRSASAVGMTIKHARRPRSDFLRLRERDDIVRFHRVTDWVTRDAPLVADLLYECDLLASRVEQVLRGASQRVATRWILGVAMHLLGFLERDAGDGDRAAEERAFVTDQRAKLAEVEAYYRRAASQAGRVVYVSGMLIGLVLIAALVVLAAWLLSGTDTSVHHRHLALLCCGSGALGALVSTIARMSDQGSGKFNIDFELGRPLIRRLGVFRPFVGAIFGLALFFLLSSGLLQLKPSAGLEPYYYGFAAFVAGFSERFATGILGAAESRLAPGQLADAHGAGSAPEAARSPD